jgi:glycosyltransferase involved in cell wall biosynthesis
MRVFVVIPAYEAAATLERVFARVPPEARATIERFLVVNDGSRDETGAVARRLAASDPTITVVDHPENRGYARAQKTGFTAALEQGADIAVLLHADGQYAPEMLPTLLRPLLEGRADVVQGSRMIQPRAALAGGMPLYKFVANRVLSRLENWVYGMTLAEYHSGYMLYSARALRTIPFLKLSDTFHFDGEMLFMAHRKGLRIVEIPIPTHYGSEKSHLRPIRYGFDVLGIMFRYLTGRYDS